MIGNGLLLKVLGAGLWMLCAVVANADHCDSNMCVAQVKKLYVHENGLVYVQANAV